MKHAGSDATRYRDLQMIRPSTNVTKEFEMAGSPRSMLNDHPCLQKADVPMSRKHH
jgi:hypothetical protein